MVINPNKQVRKAVIDAIKASVQLPVYENIVPIDNALNSQYILVNSLSKRKLETSKTCYEWNVSFNIDIHIVNEKGFSHSVAVDDIEEIIMSAMETVKVQGRHIKNRELVDSVSSLVELPDHTINRTVIIYNLWLA